MTERRGDQGFSVAPTRIDGTGGGWRGRRRRLTTWLVLAAAAAVVAIAVLGPRLQQRPSLDLSFLATPTPSSWPSPTPTLRPGATPAVTPLPRLLRGAGPIPPGTIPVQTDLFRLLDPTTGTETTGPALGYGQAAVLPAADGRGWTCVCLVDEVIDDVVSRVVRVIDIDETGQQASFTDVTVLGPLVERGEGQPFPLANGLDTIGDGSLAILAVARRQPEDTYAFSVAALSMRDHRLTPFSTIGTASPPAASPAPGPSGPAGSGLPPSEVYLDGPHVRVAPDGGVAFLWARLQREVYPGQPPVSIAAWRLDLRADGSVAGVAEAPALAAMPPFCEYAGFVTADRLAWFCALDDERGPSTPPSWTLQLFGLDGRDAGRIALRDAPPHYLGEPLLDRANGAAYVWDPIGLILYRFDVRRMSVERVEFDPAAEVSSGVAPGGGSARPDWHDADSALYPFGYGEIAAAADGSRMYVVGLSEEAPPDAQSQPTLGIFVVDRATLALVDRWAPATNYQMLAMALDDRAVAATSFAGAAPDGRPAPWDSALTLHDVTDGRVIALFGRLGQGLAPLVIEP